LRPRHPLTRLAGVILRLPRYLKLAQALMREQSIAPRRKAALVAGFGYAILPFDLLPGIIPIIGQLDDLAALLLGLRHALKGCPDDLARAHVREAGLSQTALNADLASVRVAGIWLGIKGAKFGARVLGAPLRLLARLTRRTSV